MPRKKRIVCHENSSDIKPEEIELSRPLRRSSRKIPSSDLQPEKPSKHLKCASLELEQTTEKQKVVKKTKIKNDVCVPSSVHDSPDSTDSGIYSGLSIKDENESVMLSAMDCSTPDNSIKNEIDEGNTRIPKKEMPQKRLKRKIKDTEHSNPEITASKKKPSSKKDVKTVKTVNVEIKSSLNKMASPELSRNSNFKCDNDDSVTQEGSVLQVLTQLEFASTSDMNISNVDKSEKLSEESSSDSDWEEVEEQKEQNLEDYNPVIPKDGVEITIDCPDLNVRKRKKKQFDEMEYIRLYINRERKENQMNAYKTHMLCFLAHSFFVNDILNSALIKAFALSFIPNDISLLTAGRKIDKVDCEGIEKIVLWFRNEFSYENNQHAFLNFKENFTKSFQNKKSLNCSEYNLMFIVIARTLGFKTRLCISLYPITHKAQNLLKKPNSKKNVNVKTKVEEPNSKKNVNVKTKVEEPNSSKLAKSDEKIKPAESKKVKETKSKKKKLDESLIEPKSRSRRSVKKNYKLSSEDSDEEDKNAKVKVAEQNSSKLANTDEKHKLAESEKLQESKSIKRKSSSNRKSSSKHSEEKNYELSSDDSDEDFVEEECKIPKTKKVSKSSVKKQSSRKVLSSDSSPERNDIKYDEIICWAEVFCKPSRQWISVECVNNIVNKPYDIEKLLPQPVKYIIALDNDSFVKDITRRYCSEYMTSTLKLRPDSEWWEETLEPYLPPNSKLNKEEENKLDEMLINKPLPTTVSGFKNHPLYALKRHLLKFEGIYPPDAAPVGFLRGEPIYPRECVCQLHSRETWVKEARVVRVGEEPYKIVKARPKWDRIAGVMRTDLPLEIFGLWQTEPYQPPVAVDGKVPRNEYGNVELFKPCMLPIGTVHLQIPGLNRIAKKLGIDCSPAVVGFDGHKGSIHPVFDGFVVCKEFKETLLAAWEEEQENAKKREEEKREKRIYGNWRKLIRGLLIREKIKLKYDVK